MALQEDLFHRVKHFTGYGVDFRNMNLLSLSQIYVFELSLGRLEGKGLLAKLKKYSLDNYVKAAVSLFARKGTRIRNSKYLFVNDVYNNSMVENMRAVQGEFGEEFIELVSDKRLLSENSKLVYRYFNPLSFVAEFFQLLRLISGNATTINGLCAAFRIKKGLLVLNMIDSLFMVNCADRFLRSHQQVSDIVLNTDAHKLSRILVLLAKRNNQRTYVIQHGATVLEYGYLPVIANYLLSWGKLSNDWFIRRETPPEKLVALGTPKMDDFVKYRSNPDDKREVENVLVVLNPVGDSNVRRMLQIIRRAELDRDYNLKIKLHPGSVDNRELVDEVFEGACVEIIKHANVHELIHRADVVITTTSTVGNETIALNKPLVQIKMADIQAVMDYETRDCSHIIAEPQQLKRLIRNQDKLESKKANYPNFTADYFYRLDGKSAERISRYILDHP